MGIRMSRLITFGCSFTYGTGLTDPSTLSWPALLGKQLNRKVINKSIPGSSNLEILHNILKFKFREDDLVVVGWTFCHRDVIFNSVSNNVRISMGQNVDLFKKWLDVHSNYDNNVRSGMYIHHAELYLNSLNVKHYNVWGAPEPDNFVDRMFDLIGGHRLSSLPKIINNKTFYKNILKLEDLGLDNDHPGPIAHKNAAERLFRIINEK